MTTAKQIIIDGVEVSRCCYYNKGTCLGCFVLDKNGCLSCYGICKKINNCYYKNLKYKEQECEELKKENVNLKDIIDEKNKTITWFKDRLDQYNEVIAKIRDALGLKLSTFDGVTVLKQIL